MPGKVVPFRKKGKDDDVQLTEQIVINDPTKDLEIELRAYVARTQIGQALPADQVARDLLMGMARRGWVLIRADDFK